MDNIKNKKKSLLLLLIIIFIIFITSIRIYFVNKNTHQYKTYHENVVAGNTVDIGDIQLTFGQSSEPIIKESESYAGAKSVIYELPIEITKNIDGPLYANSKFGVYESYKDFQNLPIVRFKDAKTNNNLFLSLDSLEKGEKLKITIETGLIQGDFFDYYDDYSVEKAAYIILAGSPSEKGLPLYHYKIQKIPEF